MIFTALCGLGILIAGIFINRYPAAGRFIKIKRSFNIEAVAASKILKPVLDFCTRNENARMYRSCKNIINSSETNISVRAFYLIKITALIITAVIMILVRYTNMDAIKTAVISKSMTGSSLLKDKTPDNSMYSIALYGAIIKKIGEENLKRIDDNKRLITVRKAVSELIHPNNEEDVKVKAEAFVRSYTTISGYKLLDGITAALIIISFWLPEAVLLLISIIRNNRYKKEVIKLESIFELLGSIKGFKTIEIIDEMRKSSRPYRKHLNSCMDLFKTEKELAICSLKQLNKNRRFSRLVDIIRIYAVVDKKLALQILDRSRLEKEEEIMLTAQEDVDAVDIIAFISIVPVLYELANLFMKPMLDMIYEAFSFI